jgi:PRTRC genetic system protein A
MNAQEIDAFLASTMPVVPVPKTAGLPSLEEDGQRLLVAGDGLWLEVKRAWLHARVPLAQQAEVTLPYGGVEKTITFRMPPLRVDQGSLDWFIAEAKRVYPREVAGGIYWNEETGDVRNVIFESTEASGSEVKYKRPETAANEHLIVDVHSHGVWRAFFSEQDDEDDRGEVKIAVVLGDVMSSEGPEVKSRMCLLGKYLKGIEERLKA